MASRPIKAGETVLLAKPYCWVPDAGSRILRCANCLDSLERSSMICCSGCEYVYYCTDSCQRQDKALHRLECSFLPYFRTTFAPSVSEYVVDYTWMLIRSLCRRSLERSSVVEHGDLMSFDDIWRLCSNMDDFSSARKQEFRRVTQVLLDFVRHLPDYTDDDDDYYSEQSLYELICKEECNSFGLYSFSKQFQERQGYGLAIFPSAVYFNHSCAPNIVHTTINHLDEAFYAARDIDAGEELNIKYISIRQGREERRQELQEVFLFGCECLRCRSVESNDVIEERVKSFLCGQPQCHGAYLPYTDDVLGRVSGAVALQWICEACQQPRAV